MPDFIKNINFQGDRGIWGTVIILSFLSVLSCLSFKLSIFLVLLLLFDGASAMLVKSKSDMVCFSIFVLLLKYCIGNLNVFISMIIIEIDTCVITYYCLIVSGSSTIFV